MVDVVQLVEHQFVALGVAGSSPVIHPILIVEPPHEALVAQLDRASDFGSEGWGFESLRAC